MPRDFFDPTPEQQNVVLIDAATLREAERLIESCEHCNPDGAEIPFDNILDRVTGSDPSATDYILDEPRDVRIVAVRFLKKLSLSLPDASTSQSLLSRCAGCWDWVCDCVHCAEPLNIKRQPVKDVQIRSVGYDRRRS